MSITIDFFHRAGACSRRRSIRTAEDESHYNKRTGVCFLIVGRVRNAFACRKTHFKASPFVRGFIAR